MKRFSKLKKQIESLFAPELNMQFCCIAYPIKSNRDTRSLPRFYVKLGKKVIWDCPKDFDIKGEDVYLWAADNNITDLVRQYIDTPIDGLLACHFKKDQWALRVSHDTEGQNNVSTIPYHLTDLCKAADRRLGKDKLIAWAGETNHGHVKLILEKRFKLYSCNE